MSAASVADASSAEEPPSGQPDALKATWSNWWGSHQLFASVASAAEGAVRREDRQAVATSSFLVATPRGAIEYSSVQEFAAAAAPELLRGFRQVRSLTTGAGVCVSFSLNRPKRFDPAGEGAAQLSISGESGKVSLPAVGRAAAVTAGRGYRFFWGGCQVPQELGGQRFHEQFGNLIRAAINFVVAVVLGVAGFLLFAHLPGFRFPVVAVMIAGFLLPWVIDTVIPRIEIAFRGRTRLIVILAALGGAVGSVLLPKVISAIAQ